MYSERGINDLKRRLLSTKEMEIGVHVTDPTTLLYHRQFPPFSLGL